MSFIKGLKWYQMATLMTFTWLLWSCGGSDGGAPAGTTGAQAGPAYAYLATWNTLTTYSIDPSTGGLMAPEGPPLTFQDLPSISSIAQIATDPSGQFLYLLDVSSVHAYTINPNSGALTEIAGSPFSCYEPISLAFDASGTHLYVSGSGAGPIAVPASISAYAIDSTGGLKGLAKYAVSGAGTIAVAGNYLYAADFYANSVTVFSVGASGELTPRNLPGSPFATDTGPESIVADPSGSVLYTANLGMATASEPAPGSISAYTIDSSTGALTSVAGSPLQIPVSGAISIDSTGKFLFVPEANGVAVYAINTSTGALSAIAGAPFATGTNPGWVSIDPVSKTVYVLNRGSANVSEFTLGSTGALTPLAGSPVAVGTNPCCMAVVHY
jgi:6-phosphogluconolactonase